MTVQELKKQVDKLMKDGFKDAPIKFQGQKVRPIVENGWEFDRKLKAERSYINFFWFGE